MLCLAVADAIEVTDADDKTVVITSSERIVSLNGSTTEILFALGVGENVVGCDASSSYPKGVKEKLPSVGYQYGLNAEGILSLNPTLVIGRNDVRPPQVVQQLRMAGVTALLLKEPRSFETAKQRLLTIGKAVGREKKAEELMAALDADIKKLETKLAARKDEPKQKALFLYLRGTQTTLVLGTDTAPGAMFDIEAKIRETSRNNETAEAVTLRTKSNALFSTAGTPGLRERTNQTRFSTHNLPGKKQDGVVTLSDNTCPDFGPRSCAAHSHHPRHTKKATLFQQANNSICIAP